MASVDVVIPCYNYGRFLGDCVRSVQAQDVDQLRILIIDNASTDDSVDVARRLAAKDSRIQIVARPTNLGHHASFNEGIDWAKADTFMILPADDILPAGSLRRALSIMRRQPNVSIAYGKDLSYQDGEPLPTILATDAVNWRVIDGHQFIEERCRAPHYYVAGCALVQTALQKRAGHYRTALPHTDDLEMLLRLACLGPVAETKAVQGIRREHGANRYNAFWADRQQDLLEREAAFNSFFSQEGRSIPDADRLQQIATRRLADWAYWSSVSHLSRGHWKAGRALFGFAVQRHPRTAVLPPLGYLRRMDMPLTRAREILTETGRRFATERGERSQNCAGRRRGIC